MSQFDAFDLARPLSVSAGCLDRLAGDPDVDSDVVSFTSAIGAVQWPVAIELMISMEERGQSQLDLRVRLEVDFSINH